MKVFVRDEVFAQHWFNSVDLYTKNPDAFPSHLARAFFGRNLATVGNPSWRYTKKEKGKKEEGRRRKKSVTHTCARTHTHTLFPPLKTPLFLSLFSLFSAHSHVGDSDD